MEKSLLEGDHLYVSKVTFGPRIPNTPLSLPFVQHTIPGTDKKSYVDGVKWDTKRLKGFKQLERGEPVVFNFPTGDTVCIDRQNVSYYHIIREEMERFRLIDQNTGQTSKSEDEYYTASRAKVNQEHEIVVRPLDKRDNYIKRCVAVPGDTLEIINGIVYINGNKQPDIENMQYIYQIKTDGRAIANRILKKLGIYKSDVGWSLDKSYGEIYLTKEMADIISKLKNVISVNRYITPKDTTDYQIFPWDKRYSLNRDQFGPLYIPKEGETISLTLNNLPLYERVIGYCDGSSLEVKDSVIYINGKATAQYTFKQDYYWMMCDNRHNSIDSRYWGFVPEDHIIGRPRFVWLSLNKEESFPTNIRLKRMFHIIN